jgi:hypothetical protein
MTVVTGSDALSYIRRILPRGLYRLGPPITFRGWRCAPAWSAQPLTRGRAARDLGKALMLLSVLPEALEAVRR